ncbi:MAG TPA: terminase [Edaphobacter sp.]
MSSRKTRVGKQEVKRDEEKWDVERLLEIGKELETRPELMAQRIAEMLEVRGRNGKLTRLEANRVQLLFEEKRSRQNIVLKARQMGITTWVAARFFLKTITACGVLTVQVAQTKEAAEGIFRMVQRFWENLPEELRKGPLRRSPANKGQMRFPELDSEFRILSAGDEGAGRGLTIQNLHCSELSRWPGDARETLAGLRAALTPEGELVMESTPNGAHGCFYEEWKRAESNGTARHFFPWWLEGGYVADEVTDPTEEEQRLMREHNLSPQQMGFRRGLEASYRGLRVQEFAENAESCFKASGDCYFDIAAIEKRLVDAPNPIGTERGLQTWFDPIDGRKYLVAVDTTGGSPDGDFAAMQVIDLETGLQCAELQRHMGTLDQARMAVKLARRYGGAMIAVERNNHGAAVLAYLDSAERYENIYEKNGVAGWLTTAGNKPGMVSRMGALLVDSPGLVSSRRLLAECRSFVSLPGGRTGAANGAHDDLVMAMAIAQAVRAELPYQNCQVGTAMAIAQR